MKNWLSMSALELVTILLEENVIFYHVDPLISTDLVNNARR
jgi:hypothetical protein